MSLNVTDLLAVFDLKEKNHSQIETILFEYGTLNQKLENLEAQSFFFKKGIENHKLRSIELKKEWEVIRANINTTSIDELIFVLNDTNNQLVKLNDKKRFRTNDFLHSASLKSKIANIEEFLSVKGRVKEVFEIEYYLKNKEELMELLGI